MKQIYIFLVFSFMGFFCSAQGYKIEVELGQAANSEVKLTYYYLGKIYSADTTLLDDAGCGIFQGDSLLHQGLYKIVLNSDMHFDFLLGADQQFKIINPTFNSIDMKIKGASETKGFVDYLKFFDDLRKQKKQLNAEFSNAESSDKKGAIKKEIEQLDNKMLEYRENVSKKYPDSFLPKFIIADYVPELDASSLPQTVRENDSLLFETMYKFEREHYWDYFDYTDERYLYTPFYKPKLEKWFSNVLYPSYDSVKPYVYQFIDDVKPSKRLFQFVTSYFLNASIKSNIMGMDALFVDLARDYYISGKAFWASKETMDKVKENYLFLKDNLIGEQAYDLNLKSIAGDFVDLYKVDAKLTVLVIYEPDCSHCKVYVPQLYREVYMPNKDKGLAVYAIYSMDNKKEWEDFLNKEGLHEWINVWDEDDVSRFKIKYDGRSTPAVYVLDENKKIIAKQLRVEQIKQMVEKELK